MANAMNAVMGGVLRTPLVHRALSGQLLVVEVIGRKTGRRYRVPLAYRRSGDALLVVTEGRWRRNLVEGRPVGVLLRGRTEQMSPEVIADEAGCTPLLREILTHSPALRRQLRIDVNPEGDPDSADVRAGLERGLACILLRPAPDPGT